MRKIATKPRSKRKEKQKKTAKEEKPYKNKETE
jgi:hypothetical protein